MPDIRGNNGLNSLLVESIMKLLTLRLSISSQRPSSNLLYVLFAKYYSHNGEGDKREGVLLHSLFWIFYLDPTRIVSQQLSTTKNEQNRNNAFLDIHGNF
jgi:hypothetical protein